MSYIAFKNGRSNHFCTGKRPPPHPVGCVLERFFFFSERAFRTFFRIPFPTQSTEKRFNRNTWYAYDIELNIVCDRLGEILIKKKTDFFVHKSTLHRPTRLLWYLNIDGCEFVEITAVQTIGIRAAAEISYRILQNFFVTFKSFIFPST